MTALVAFLVSRRATQVSVVAGIVIGLGCLLVGSPAWAAITFAGAATDAWMLKSWRFPS